MKHEYESLMGRIRVPEELNRRVLTAARQEAPRQNKRKPVWRAAVCTALALALVVGGVTLGPSGDPKQLDRRIFREDSSAVLPLTDTFVLTAYAAEPDAQPVIPVNGGVTFGGGSGAYWSKKDGYYSSCMFRITGEGIQEISLSIDTGEFYRLKALEHMTAKERKELKQARAEGMAMPDTLPGVEDGREVHQTMIRVGNQLTEKYDPSVSYGFWLPALKKTDVPEGVTSPDTQASIDLLKGARLTVSVLYTDGTEQQKVYTLSTGRFKAVWNEDGTKSLLPGLAGDNEPYFYGVCASDETESVWFRWPVAGSNTVSLSAPYGRYTLVLTSDPPAGQSTFVHTGIDIPAQQGTDISAALAGTVTETGFDPERGNYLILDHGNGLTTLYGQCQEVLVQTGDAVAEGETVALLGATGMATGPHLHFEVRQDGEPQNPVAYFDAETRDQLKMG